MADYPVYTANDLAAYSGRDVASYSSYATQAVTQATLLFKLATCLKEFPEDEMSQQIASFAILAMADAIVLVQPYQEVLSNPFTSESIGSYSYSKMASKVSSGLPTGVSWFDTAVFQIGVCDLNSDVLSGGGIEVFEFDGVFASGIRGNNTRFLSPQDIDTSRAFGYDPAPRDSTLRVLP